MVQTKINTNHNDDGNFNHPAKNHCHDCEYFAVSTQYHPAYSDHYSAYHYYSWHCHLHCGC